MNKVTSVVRWPRYIPEWELWAGGCGSPAYSQTLDKPAKHKPHIQHQAIASTSFNDEF